MLDVLFEGLEASSVAWTSFSRIFLQFLVFENLNLDPDSTKSLDLDSVNLDPKHCIKRQQRGPVFYHSILFIIAFCSLDAQI